MLVRAMQVFAEMFTIVTSNNGKDRKHQQHGDRFELLPSIKFYENLKVHKNSSVQKQENKTNFHWKLTVLLVVYSC